MDVNLNGFAQVCHSISESKGWTTLKRTDTQLCNLMISECIEALEDFRDNKKIDETYYEVKYTTSDVDAGSKHSKSMSSAEFLEFKKNEGSAYRIDSAKPCGIPTELADFIIRCGQFFGTNKLDLSKAVESADSTYVDSDFNEMLADVMYAISRARRSSPERGIDPNRDALTLHLGEAFYIVVEFCERNDIDIWAAVKEKNEYNATRPHLHGGKKI